MQILFKLARVRHTQGATSHGEHSLWRARDWRTAIGSRSTFQLIVHGCPRFKIHTPRFELQRWLRLSRPLWRCRRFKPHPLLSKAIPAFHFWHTGTSDHVQQNNTEVCPQRYDKVWRIGQRHSPFPTTLDRTKSRLFEMGSEGDLLLEI